MLKSYIGFVSRVPAPGPESRWLVRSAEAEWWEGNETLIAPQINNNFSYIASVLQHKSLQSDAAFIMVLL